MQGGLKKREKKKTHNLLIQDFGFSFNFFIKSHLKMLL